MDAETKRPLSFYLQFIAPVVSLVSALVVGSIWVISYAGKTDQATTAINEFKAEYRRTIDVVLSKLEVIPLDRQRLEQLERNDQVRMGQIGGLDARLQLAERRGDVLTSDVENIKAASGVRLKP